MIVDIRWTSRSATGREIKRTRRVERDAPTIGRDPGSDIHLPDLGVGLHEAELRLAEPGLVEVAGRTVDLAEGATLGFGAHRLTLGPGGEGADLTLEVAREGALSHSAADKDERRLFSLQGVAPDKRRVAWATALAVLLAFLAWPVLSFYQRTPARIGGSGAMTPIHADAAWSPGALSTAHAELEGNCASCHQEVFVSVRDTGCTGCHKQAHAHAEPTRLARAGPALDWGGRARRAVAVAFNRPPGRCVDCHTEHEGAGRMEPTAQKFCADCHSTMDARLTDTRWINAGDFGTDHPQFRPAVVREPGPRPRTERVSLDRKPKERSGLVFPHALHLSRTNAVARMAGGGGMTCAGCHAGDGKGGFKPVEMEAGCRSCHSLAFGRDGGGVRNLPHGSAQQVVATLRGHLAASGPVAPVGLGGAARRRPGDFAAASIAATYGRAVATDGVADARRIRAVFQPGGACFDCHRVVAPNSAGSLDFRIAPVSVTDRYLAHGWFDHRAHAKQTCASCHAAPTSNDAADVLLPPIAQCRTCHVGADATPKRGQVATACATCHEYHQPPGPARGGRDGRPGPLATQVPIRIAWR